MAVGTDRISKSGNECNRKQEHIIRETTNYAKVAHNDSTFSITEENLKHYVGVIFLSGYHYLPQSIFIGKDVMM